MSRAVPGGSAPKRPGASSRGQLQPKKRKINDTQDLSRASKADEEAKKAKEECSGVSGDLRHQPREPSKTEWKEMHHVNPVAWSTSEHDQTTYEIGQDVVIVPHYRDIKKSKKNADKMLKFEDLWYGRILDMRCGDLDHPDDVWLKVAWHYSPAWFMTTKARGTRLKDFGPYELIYTPTHTDLIHADSLNGVEKIFPYDEEDHDQQDIPDKAFHVRSIYDTTDKEWITAPPSRLCVCKESFKVHDKKKRVMHYCPRAGCHQWYHEDCLFKLKWYQMKEDVTFFENLWQFAFDETKIDAIVREVAALPRETSKYSSGFDGMPSAVLSFARQPIVKGGNYRMGNMGAVLRARHILHQALRRGIAPPDGAVEYILYTGPAPARARASDAESDTESDTVRVYGEEEGDECIVVGEKEGGRAESGSTHGDPVGAREKRVSGARFEHIRYGTVWLAYTCPECKNPI